MKTKQKLLSFLLATVLLFSAAPFPSTFANIASAGSKKQWYDKVDVWLNDLSEKTFVEYWYKDETNGKSVDQNGGYETYNALRTGEIGVEEKNKKYYYTFLTEKRYVAVPVEAFANNTAGTDFQYINKLLTKPLNNHTADSQMRCMFKCSETDESNFCVFTQITWLGFQSRFRGSSIKLGCTRYGSALFTYHPVVYEITYSYFFGLIKTASIITPHLYPYDVDNPFAVVLVKTINTEKAKNKKEAYYAALERVNDKGKKSNWFNSNSIGNFIPQFRLAYKDNKEYEFTDCEITCKGKRNATINEQLKAGMDLVQLFFIPIDIFIEYKDGYKLLKNITKLAGTFSDPDSSPLITFEGVTESVTGKTSFPAYGNSRKGRNAWISHSPLRLTNCDDYFETVFWLNGFPKKDEGEFTAIFLLEEYINTKTEAKTYFSYNYRTVDTKAENTGYNLTFSGVNADCSASTTDTILTTLSGKISNPDNRSISSYGFYLKEGSSSFTSNDIVGKNGNATTKSSISASYSTNSLKPDTLYYYKLFATTSNGLYYSETKSFRTPKVKPKDTKITSVKTVDYLTQRELNSAELGIGDTVKVKWDKAQYAEYYTVKVNGVENTNKIYLTEQTIQLTQPGTNTISVCAHNSVGSSAWTPESTATVHEDVTVRFMTKAEADDNSDCETKTLCWNHELAELPVSPSITGGTFMGWYRQDGKLITTGIRITDNTDVYAGYNRNSYKVKFLDGNGSVLPVTLNPGTEEAQTVTEQTVFYGNDAVAPDPADVPMPAGYHFLGWNADYTHVTTPLTVQAVADADNHDIPVLISEANATRYSTRYVVNCTVKNRLLNETQGRLIVALKNSEGRLITTTESYVYYIDANENITNEDALKTETIRIFVPIDKKMDAAGLVADYAEIYLIQDFQSTVPVGEHYTVGIVDADPWSAWSTTQTEKYMNAGPENQQQKTQYQYRDLQKKTTYSLAEKQQLTAEGWTWDSSSVKTGTPNISAWSETKPAEQENRTVEEKTVIDTAQKTEYRYKRYNYYNKYHNATYFTYGSTWANNQGFSGSWEYKTSYSPLKYLEDTSDGVAKYGTKSDFWFAAGVNTKQGTSYNGKDFTVNSEEVTVNTGTHKEYRTLDYPFYLTYWPLTFSEFSDTPVEAVEGEREVQTQTLYRYYTQLPERKGEADPGTVRTDYTAGNIGSENAGKQAILFIYKINEASDWTTEYIGQTVIGEDGSYHFDPYILREEPSAVTGDYMVSLALEGAKEQIFLGKIEVPDSEYVYTVKYLDTLNNNAVISEQTVIRGADAEIPEPPEHEGYEFCYWDTRSIDIRADTTINAIYKERVHTVVFVDPLNEATPATIAYIKHGEPLYNYLPEYSRTEELYLHRWDTDARTEVISDMVVTAIYEPMPVDVLFRWERNPDDPDHSYLLDVQWLYYGDRITPPTLWLDSIGTFVGWTIKGSPDEIVDIETITVTDDMWFVPVFVYDDTADTPVLSTETGSYATAQTVTLGTENADETILYTLDGSDPASSETAGAVPAGSEITIEESCMLRAVAVGDYKNMSAETSAVYAINSSEATDKCVLRLGNMDGDDRFGTYIVDKGSTIEAVVHDYLGITLENAYRTITYLEEEDNCTVQYENVWSIASDTVTEDITLYLDLSEYMLQVTFMDDDGFVFSTESIPYGSMAEQPEIPEKDGYVFTGWDSDAYTFVTQDVDIVAVYVPEDQYATVTLDKTSYSTMVGSGFELTPQIGGNGSPLEWYSDDEDVAVVDENGYVTATGKGCVRIYAVALESGEFDMCEVTVTANPSVELVIDHTSGIYENEAGYLVGLTITTKEGVHFAPTVAEVKTAFLSKGLEFISSGGTELAESDHVGTGTVIRFAGSSSDEQLTVIVKGDLDGDGYVTNRDASRAARYLVNKETLNETQRAAVDMNGDGKVNNRDASFLARFLVGKEKI